MPIGMSLIAFGQSFGGTLFLAGGSTAFSAGLNSALKKYAPEVSPAAVATAGATGFRAILPTDSIAGVIKAYQIGVQHVFYLSCGCAAMVFVMAWGLGWKSVKKAKVVEPAA
jgi:hypothetical protein